MSLGEYLLCMVSTGRTVTTACGGDDDATRLHCLFDLVYLTYVFSHNDLKEILYPRVTLKLFV